MKIITFIIALFIVFSAVIFISEGSRRRDKETYDNIIKESKEREKLLKLQFDSLQSSYSILEKHYKDVSDAYNKASKEADTANKKYEKIRNSKPVAYTDKQIDSVLNRYYPRP